MTTISSHALHPPSPKSINVASSWSLKALQIADQGLTNADKTDPACRLCGRAKSVGLYNLGMLAEVSFSRDCACKAEYDCGGAETRCKITLKKLLIDSQSL